MLPDSFTKGLEHEINKLKVGSPALKFSDTTTLLREQGFDLASIIGMAMDGALDELFSVEDKDEQRGEESTAEHTEKEEKTALGEAETNVLGGLENEIGGEKGIPIIGQIKLDVDFTKRYFIVKRYFQSTKNKIVEREAYPKVERIIRLVANYAILAIEESGRLLQMSRSNIKEMSSFVPEAKMCLEKLALLRTQQNFKIVFAPENQDFDLPTHKSIEDMYWGLKDCIRSAEEKLYGEVASPLTALAFEKLLPIIDKVKQAHSEYYKTANSAKQKNELRIAAVERACKVLEDEIYPLLDNVIPLVLQAVLKNYKKNIEQKKQCGELGTGEKLLSPLVSIAETAICGVKTNSNIELVIGVFAYLGSGLLKNPSSSPVFIQKAFPIVSKFKELITIPNGSGRDNTEAEQKDFLLFFTEVLSKVVTNLQQSKRMNFYKWVGGVITGFSLENLKDSGASLFHKILQTIKSCLAISERALSKLCAIGKIQEDSNSLSNVVSIIPPIESEVRNLLQKIPEGKQGFDGDLSFLREEARLCREWLSKVQAECKKGQGDLERIKGDDVSSCEEKLQKIEEEITKLTSQVDKKEQENEKEEEKKQEEEKRPAVDGQAEQEKKVIEIRGNLSELQKLSIYTLSFDENDTLSQQKKERLFERKMLQMQLDSAKVEKDISKVDKLRSEIEENEANVKKNKDDIAQNLENKSKKTEKSCQNGESEEELSLLLFRKEMDIFNKWLLVVEKRIGLIEKDKSKYEISECRKRMCGINYDYLDLSVGYHYDDGIRKYVMLPFDADKKSIEKRMRENLEKLEQYAFYTQEFKEDRALCLQKQLWEIELQRFFAEREKNENLEKLVPKDENALRNELIKALEEENKLKEKEIKEIQLKEWHFDKSTFALSTLLNPINMGFFVIGAKTANVGDIDSIVSNAGEAITKLLGLKDVAEVLGYFLKYAAFYLDKGVKIYSNDIHKLIEQMASAQTKTNLDEQAREFSRVTSVVSRQVETVLLHQEQSLASLISENEERISQLQLCVQEKDTELAEIEQEIEREEQIVGATPGDEEEPIREEEQEEAPRRNEPKRKTEPRESERQKQLKSKKDSIEKECDALRKSIAALEKENEDNKEDKQAIPEKIKKLPTKKNRLKKSQDNLERLQKELFGNTNDIDGVRMLMLQHVAPKEQEKLAKLLKQRQELLVKWKTLVREKRQELGRRKEDLKKKKEKHEVIEGDDNVDDSVQALLPTIALEETATLKKIAELKIQIKQGRYELSGLEAKWKEECVKQNEAMKQKLVEVKCAPSEEGLQKLREEFELPARPQQIDELQVLQFKLTKELKSLESKLAELKAEREGIPKQQEALELLEREITSLERNIEKVGNKPQDEVKGEEEPGQGEQEAENGDDGAISGIKKKLQLIEAKQNEIIAKQNEVDELQKLPDDEPQNHGQDCEKLVIEGSMLWVVASILTKWGSKLGYLQKEEENKQRGVLEPTSESQSVEKRDAFDSRKTSDLTKEIELLIRGDNQCGIIDGARNNLALDLYNKGKSTYTSDIKLQERRKNEKARELKREAQEKKKEEERQRIEEEKRKEDERKRMEEERQRLEQERERIAKKKLEERAKLRAEWEEKDRVALLDVNEGEIKSLETKLKAGVPTKEEFVKDVFIGDVTGLEALTAISEVQLKGWNEEIANILAQEPPSVFSIVASSALATVLWETLADQRAFNTETLSEGKKLKLIELIINCAKIEIRNILDPDYQDNIQEALENFIIILNGLLASTKWLKSEEKTEIKTQIALELKRLIIKSAEMAKREALFYSLASLLASETTPILTIAEVKELKIRDIILLKCENSGGAFLQIVADKLLPLMSQEERLLLLDLNSDFFVCPLNVNAESWKKELIAGIPFILKALPSDKSRADFLLKNTAFLTNNIETIEQFEAMLQTMQEPDRGVFLTHDGNRAFIQAVLTRVSSENNEKYVAGLVRLALLLPVDKRRDFTLCFIDAANITTLEQLKSILNILPEPMRLAFLTNAKTKVFIRTALANVSRGNGGSYVEAMTQLFPLLLEGERLTFIKYLITSEVFFARPEWAKEGEWNQQLLYGFSYILAALPNLETQKEFLQLEKIAQFLKANTKDLSQLLSIVMVTDIAANDLEEFLKACKHDEIMDSTQSKGADLKKIESIDKSYKKAPLVWKTMMRLFMLKFGSVGDLCEYLVKITGLFNVRLGVLIPFLYEEFFDEEYLAKRVLYQHKLKAILEGIRSDLCVNYKKQVEVFDALQEAREHGQRMIREERRKKGNGELQVKKEVPKPVTSKTKVEISPQQQTEQNPPVKKEEEKPVDIEQLHKNRQGPLGKFVKRKEIPVVRQHTKEKIERAKVIREKEGEVDRLQEQVQAKVLEKNDLERQVIEKAREKQAVEVTLEGDNARKAEKLRGQEELLTQKTKLNDEIGIINAAIGVENQSNRLGKENMESSHRRGRISSYIGNVVSVFIALLLALSIVAFVAMVVLLLTLTTQLQWIFIIPMCVGIVSAALSFLFIIARIMCSGFSINLGKAKFVEAHAHDGALVDKKAELDVVVTQRLPALDTELLGLDTAIREKKEIIAQKTTVLDDVTRNFDVKQKDLDNCQAALRRKQEALSLLQREDNEKGSITSVLEGGRSTFFSGRRVAMPEPVFAQVVAYQDDLVM